MGVNCGVIGGCDLLVLACKREFQKFHQEDTHTNNFTTLEEDVGQEQIHRQCAVGRFSFLGAIDVAWLQKFGWSQPFCLFC